MNDEYFMSLALEEAKIALEENEVPVGAILVMDNKIIAKGHNTKEKDKLRANIFKNMLLNLE